ncbi:type I secretion system permease/ATPase [Methylobacterium marchantiae]|uniref:Type I secretion system permease/ATPase n=1 Tax=Methylobacterium marchantiae TaxID=600331 RepID=A0ABW3X173_9HYPH|nr:Type I secretion system ATP-binding protein PrsD [Methylobacterium marchantiae]
MQIKTDPSPSKTEASELTAALAPCRWALISLGVVSGLVNLLYLTGSFFMLEVYDRVIPSRSIPTLVGLCLIALALYVFQGGLEILRSRALGRIGSALEEAIGPRVFDTVVRAPLKGTMPGDGLLPVRDLDALRAFLSGPAPGALFDLPWMPFYLAICFLFHPLIGVAALFGGVVLLTLTVLNDRLTRSHSQAATGFALSRNGLAESGRRNAAVLASMGMQEAFTVRWAEASASYLRTQARVADVAVGFGAASKVFRLALQSGVLALGAYLVINGQASSGVIIASSILVSRALAPAELAIANWRGFVAARQSWHRLDILFSALPPVPSPHPLPAPHLSLSLDALCLTPPASGRVVVHEVGFTLMAGEALGVVGASASGKSSLVKAIVGVWSPIKGTVRLDGASLDQWAKTALGRHIGYLPQEVELFPGPIARNIARFEADASPEAVIEAAKAAGYHEAILRLPDGYDTVIGEGGAGLSSGQRQRVGLARALYRNPFLIVLDEPNANLDADGETALAEAMLGVRQRGGIVIVVAHRPNVLATVDLILTLSEGRCIDFGPKDEVLKRMLRPAAVAGNQPPAGASPILLRRASA